MNTDSQHVLVAHSSRFLRDRVDDLLDQSVRHRHDTIAQVEDAVVVGHDDHGSFLLDGHALDEVHDDSIADKGCLSITENEKNVS